MTALGTTKLVLGQYSYNTYLYYFKTFLRYVLKLLEFLKIKKNGSLFSHFITFIIIKLMREKMMVGPEHNLQSVIIKPGYLTVHIEVRMVI